MLLFLLMLLFLSINIIFDFSGMRGFDLFWLSGQGEIGRCRYTEYFYCTSHAKDHESFRLHYWRESIRVFHAKAKPHQMFMTIRARSFDVKNQKQ